MSFLYRVYDLTFELPFESPELGDSIDPASAAPDVIVTFGAVPDTIPAAALTGAYFQRTAAQLRLDIPTIAVYHVRDGRAITIQPYPNAPESAIRTCLFDSPLSALLHQRGTATLAGCALRLPDDTAALLIKGQAMLGVSTVAAALWQDGFRLVSDTFCALNRRGKQVIALPGLRCQWLWRNALEQAALDLPPGFTWESAPRTHPALPRYRIDLPEAARWTAPLPVSRVYVFNFGREVAVKKVEGVRKVELLNGLIYRPLLAELNALPTVLAAAQADVYELFYGSEPWFARDVAALLRAHFLNPTLEAAS
ncbi:MAG: hypothetical protein SF162_10670 [bacterium]|nr:hypothetical protein [bacterium]